MSIDAAFVQVLTKSQDALIGDVELSKYIKKFGIIETIEALPYFNARPGYYGCVLMPDRTEEAWDGLGALHKTITFYFRVLCFIFLMDKEVGLVGKDKRLVRGLMQMAEDIRTVLDLNTLDAYLTRRIFVEGTEYQGVDIGDGNLFQACMINLTAEKEIEARSS